MTATHRRSPSRFLAALATLVLLIGVGIGAGAMPASASVGALTVRGTVTHNGVPVSGSNVKLYPTVSGSCCETVATDTNGNYEFTTLAADTYSGWAEHPTGSFPNAVISPFTLDSTTSPYLLNIAIQDWPTGTSSVSGTVTDSVTHSPITNAHVRFHGRPGADDSDFSVDPVTGFYQVSHLPDGAFGLSVSAPGYVDRSINFALDTADSLTQNISMVAANSIISGHLSYGGSPVASEYVSLRSTDPSIMPFSSPTDASGNFTFSGLGAGDYTVSAGGPGTAYKSQTFSVTAVANADVPANFDLELRVIGTISGTVYDENGLPLAGICVGTRSSPTEWGSGYFGGMNVGTDSTGTFTISDVDAGSYRIAFYDECSNPRRNHAEYALSYYGGLNGQASFADGAAVVSNGDNITGYNIRMVKGGSLGGKISLQTPTGVTDLPVTRGMDATLYQFAGGQWAKVPDVTAFVGGPGVGDFQVYGLYPGNYRVCFEDTMTGPRAFAHECWQNSATVEGAHDIAITAGTFTPHIDSAVGIPRPGFDPIAVPTSQLGSGTQGVISSNGVAVQGQTLDVNVGSAMAGEWVSVWGHSTPTLLNKWVQVSSTGHVSITVSTALPIGNHTLVAQDASGGVIGWSGLRVTAGSVVAANGSLAPTGVDASGWVSGGVLAILVGGALVLFMIRKRRSMV